MSGDISDLELSDFFVYANDDLLKKGAPPGLGASVTDWIADGNVLKMEISSDRYVRAHEAVLRLRKRLSESMGERRIGIRRIEIDDFTIKMESDRISSSIPFVKDAEWEDGVITLSLDVGLSDLERKIPDRIVRLVEEKNKRFAKREYWELLWESEERDILSDKDPTEEMVKRRWIKHGSARGQYIFGPQITKILRTFEKIVLEEILNPLGYSEMIFPKLVTWDIWKKSGHTKGIYPEIYYVCPPKTRDPDFWEEVIDHYKVTNEIPLDLIEEKIDKPIGGLCYAQCPPFWNFIQGETLPDEILPIKIFDRSGTSHRYESGGIHGIERLDEFHRIEIVWIGEKEEVMRHSEELQERYKYIFNDILEIRWRKAWVTPWFMAQEGLSGLSEEKEVGTIDYEASLPYNQSWLEFQNLSVNGNKYPKGFNVKIQHGELWSGCSGVGLERWASVFLAQKGLEEENWPDPFISKVGELPDVFRFF
jgi:seryl-tRNA synthetase